jgi:hypothetical protein
MEQKSNSPTSDFPYSRSPCARLEMATLAQHTYVQRWFLETKTGACAMNNSPTNHGEGNPQAAEEFNEAEQKFANSPSGKQKIKKGPQVRPDEEAELARAEQSGKSHAKNDDSNTTRMKH